MDNYLNNKIQRTEYHFEVMNFGIGFYTSMHSTVNFVIHVRDFSPDYVIFHHGWNDLDAIASDSDIRSDYFNSLKNFDFQPPPFYLKYPLRMSVLFRYAFLFIVGQPPWENLAYAVRTNTPRNPNNITKVERWYPFRKNLQTIIDLSEAEGTKVVLVTQPYSTDPHILWASDAKGMEYADEIVRQMAQENNAILVDAAEEMTGNNKLFLDVGHLNIEGTQIKANIIGEAIWEDLKKSSPYTSLFH